MRNHFEIWCEELGVEASDPKTITGTPMFTTRPTPRMVQTWVERIDMERGHPMPSLYHPATVSIRCPDDYVCQFFASAKRTVAYSVERNKGAGTNGEW